MEESRENEEQWLEDVKALLNELVNSDIIEFELIRGDTRVYIVRDVGSAQTAALPGEPAVPPADLSSADLNISIATPITGVFYLTASPGAPPFVAPGSPVEIGQVVALVEAMKVFNEITSEVRGTVTEILADPGSLVEKGQPLMLVREE